MMPLLQNLVAIATRQQEEIANQAKLLEAMTAQHSDGMLQLKQEVQFKLNTTLDHVTSALDAVRMETQHACHRAFPDAQQLPALQDKVRRLEQFMDTQLELSARRNAEGIALQEKVNVLQQTVTSAAAAGVDNRREAAPTDDAYRIRTDLDALLGLLEIPNAYAEISQRSLTSQSLHQLSKRSTEQKVRFLHSTPAFHVLWEELYRIRALIEAFPSPSRWQRGSMVQEGSSYQQPAIGTHPMGAPLNANPSPRQPYPSIVVDGSTIIPSGGVVFIPQLSADVCQAPGRRGVFVVRLVPGGPLDAVGVVAGDAIVDVDGTPVAGAFHLLDFLNDAEGRQNQSCKLAVVPAGRTSSIPISLRLSLQPQQHTTSR